MFLKYSPDLYDVNTFPNTHYPLKKLAIITTHPIQYYAPIFKLLHERKNVEIKVYYTWGEESSKKHDPGFEKLIEWDLPLLEGYPFEWVKNASSNPGSHRFSGIKNPHLIQQVTTWNPDAILVVGWAYQSHLKVIRHFKGKLPVYFRGDSTLIDNTAGLKLILRKWLLKWVYKHVDHAFYAGTANKKYFLQYGLDDTRLSFTPHAVDNNRFAEGKPKEAQALRNKLGLGSDDMLLLFAGKFEVKKDPLLLLRAFKESDKPNIHLLFAGNGELEKELKAHASTPGRMTKKIHFLDFQNQTQMPVLYHACDLFCLPSRGPGESWGLAINEAMACGKAILASEKVGSTYDLVKENVNGSIFKAGNIADLKEKLEHLTVSRSILQEFGKRSKGIIQEWNFEKIVLTLERTLINNS